MEQTRSTRRTAALVAAWVTVGVVGAAALTGVAMAADNAPTPQPTSSSTSTAHGQGGLAGRLNEGGEQGLAKLRHLGTRVLHGEFVVQAKGGDRTVDTQLGVITAVSATSVDVKSSDGYTQTWTLTSTSKVRGARKAGSAADLTVGATVRLIGPKPGPAGSLATVALAVLRPATS